MGTPVQDDFSRVKVTNQVQIQTFMASLEPYFRTISDEDIAFLENLRDPQESYVVPRLGKFYAQTWAEEETRFTAKHLLDSDSRGRAPLPTTSFLGADLVDSDLTLNLARLAPLTERIISALVAERLVQQLPENVGSSDSESDGEAGARQTPLSGDATSLEDRLKRELRYIGILDDGDVDWDARQDDEVSATLRSLQRQLHDQVAVNMRRKERLLPVAREHIGFQEYTQVIDELDKQVEQSYLKRHRLTKSRKRKSAPTKTVALSDNALNAMDRRRRVINAIGHLFPAEKFALPACSVFEGIQPNPEIDMK
ncbi:histone acetyltransferases subunit 3-domain-containing protein [Kickxella alabastrina]|uniref:histone acetyltransferases subunit 3-domain-containing protein n=1 Tax=Kickxella alabastrina TaxID=61397 RepID=UPI0022209A5D|nr:histone acetyltransferases subunit 3-domain-containing protein [Kickxella alabastrina]KAI7833106.1 histone acetyltransferases subunit 3-domain-containing protein [Kickxella alabastrina]